MAVVQEEAEEGDDGSVGENKGRINAVRVHILIAHWEDIVDIVRRGAPIAHIHLRPCRNAHCLQRRPCPFGPTQNEEMEDMGIGNLIPRILVLTGTKLELVIMEMAQQIQDKTNVVRGAPIVEPTNDFFWFSKPHWILFLIHFSLFENAFQMAYFLWSLMGSHMKTAIFEEQTAKAVKKWQKEAKQRQKKRSPQNTSTSRDSSPSYLLHNLNNSSSAHPVGY
nr:MLO protein homolog 1-like [Ipomoea batatas]